MPISSTVRRAVDPLRGGAHVVVRGQDVEAAGDERPQGTSMLEQRDPVVPGGVRRARCMYQSTGVVRNSRTARLTSVGRAVGNMKPL